MNQEKRKIVLITLLLAIAGCFSAYAQRLTASVSNNPVGVGQQFQVSFSFNANGSGFQPPSFSGFDVYSGPNESTSVEFVNGNVSQSITFSYILAAKKEGTFTFGPASINAGGRTFTSSPINIKVVKGSPQQNTAQSQNQGNQGNSASTVPGNDVKKNLFIKVIPTKTKVYEGEQLMVTIKIFTHYSLESVDNASFPEYNGFFSSDAGPKNQQVTLSRGNYNGTPYIIAVLKQTILCPQRSGELKIDPASIDCVVAERQKPRSFIEQIFGGGYKNVKYTIKSDPVTIDVLPLPATNKNFSGAVGQFSLKASLDKNSVKANDAVNLNVVISGNGNLKLIDSLPVKFPPDFDHYDPKITDHISTTESGTSGSRTFDYLVIPRHEGKYTIPSQEFTYFDPQKKNYVTLTIPEFNLDVAKGDNSSAVTVAEGVNKEEVKLLGQDIRYIHTGNISAVMAGNYFLFSLPFYAGIGVPLIAFLLLVFVRRKYIEMNKDVVAVKRRGATRMAHKRLKAAHKHMTANNKEAFYEEIMKAVNGYLGDKFSIPVSELSRETINAKLAEKNVKPETLQKLMSTLDNCEYARYAPATVTSNLNEVYQSTVKLITLLEDEIA